MRAAALMVPALTILGAASRIKSTRVEGLGFWFWVLGLGFRGLGFVGGDAISSEGFDRCLFRIFWG